MCGNVFAYSPIVKDIPFEVWIGDEEDNTSSPFVDLNFFRFTGAFNFDDYVTFDDNDPNDVTTDVRWSFMPEAPGLVLINGNDGITDPYTEAIEPGAEELTDRTDNSPVPRASALADFWDILDSPSSGTPPYPDPVPGTELDTWVMLFASNGSKYSCGSVHVIANVKVGSVDEPDVISVVDIVEDVWTYDMPASDGWAKSTEAGTDGTQIGTTGIYWGTHGTSGGDTISAGPAAGHTGNGFYCIWDAPANDIPYAAGYVYRTKYTLRSSQADVTKVPKIRLLTQCVGTGILAYSGGVLLAGGNVNRLFAPGAVAETYTAYMEPPTNLAAGGVTNLKPKFEVYAFSSAEYGTTIYCDEVVVQRFATPSKASAAGVIKTYSTTDGWTGWMPQTIVPPFGTATVSSNATGLYIETPGPITAMNYGRWYTPADSSGVQFTADKLYRCVYTLQSAVSTLGQIRCLNANKAADWTSKLVILPNQTQVHLPAATGTEYSNWYETMPAFHTVDPTNNNMTLDVDIADGNAAQLGRMYITKVELLYYDIP
ncbi:hypothetical protein JW926_11225 [Candidatus Sumerlaeota bacterium]|nr:hypothetical protein [Candidatus Sumerlaeota bacterium]